jgi:hypothetical protein
MSAEAFRRTLNNIPELKQWASGQRNTSSILQQTRESSRAEIENSTVDLIIPLQQLKSILGDTTANTIFNEIKSGKYLQAPEAVVYHNTAGQETVVFQGLNFRNLNKSVGGYLQQIAKDAGVDNADGISETVLSEIKNRKYDKGHVYGWANTLLQRTKGSIGEALKDPRRGVPAVQLEKELGALNQFIDTLLDIVEEYDEATSDIKGLKTKLGAKYRKTDSNWLIEWQGSAEQQRAGSAVAQVVGKQNTGIRGFLKQVGYSNQSLVEKALDSMVDGFIKQGLLSEGSQSLVELESSPAIVKLIEDRLVATISGKKRKLKSEYTGTIGNLPDLTIRNVVGADKAKADIRRTKAELKSLKQKVNKAKQEVKKQALPKTVNLVNLLAILNSQIQDVVSANMGDGTRKDILNYRTGRFASTINIDHLTMSRDGLISVFYSYMKNPYATFSAGGKQQSPKTRDPKLLIGTSIRDIASQVVANKLRAISI